MWTVTYHNIRNAVHVLYFPLSFGLAKFTGTVSDRLGPPVCCTGFRRRRLKDVFHLRLVHLTMANGNQIVSEVKPQPSSNITLDEGLKTFTFQEVTKHDEASSMWLIINDHVYDVTEFINEHPGGMEVVLEYAGMDATSAFEGKGHSLHAKQLLQKYHIGIMEIDRRG